MSAFVPEQKPLLEQIVRSTLFQIVALAFIVITVFSFARQAHRRELAERLAEIDNAQNSQVRVMSNNTSDNNLETKKIEFSSTAAANGKIDNPPSNTQPSTGFLPTSGGQGGLRGNLPNGNPDQNSGLSSGLNSGAVPPQTGDDGKGTNGTRATNLRVTFAEASRSASTDLAASVDKRTAQILGSFNTGFIAGFSAKIKSLTGAGLDSLLSTENPIKLSETIEFYGGQREETTGQFLGFVVQVLPTQLDENETHLQVRIFRNLRDSSGQIEEFSVPLPDQLNIPHGSGVVISGNFLLPRRASEADRRFYDPLKVLHIFAKDDFVKGLSDFVILLEPR